MAVTNVSDLKERIKDKLDRACNKKNHCRTITNALNKAAMKNGLYVSPCWLCHENDRLAQEIADEATRPS